MSCDKGKNNTDKQINKRKVNAQIYLLKTEKFRVKFKCITSNKDKHIFHSALKCFMTYNISLKGVDGLFDSGVCVLVCIHYRVD